MRLLVLNYEYPPVGGGAGIATRGLVRELARRGVRVDLVTSGHRHAGGTAPGQASDAPTLHRVPTWRRGLHDAGYRGAASYLLAAYPVVRRLLRANRYDLVHVFFSLPTGLLLLPLPRRLPAVVSLRGSDVPDYDGANRGLALAHRLLLPLTRAVWRRAACVVPVTDGLGRLARRFEPALRYTVVPNGVDLSLFTPRPESPEGSGPGAVRCVATARLIVRKGHHTLLEAFARLPASRYRLDLVGEGPLEPALRRAAERLGLGERVRFHGALDHAGLARLYREADLFTLLPDHEAFGNSFAEALAAGLPVVGTRVGGIPELVTDPDNGFLVPPGDAAAAAAAIARLGDSPPQCRAIALRNRRKAEAELSWPAVADRYLRIYQEAGAPRVPDAAAFAAQAR